ncbi:hypothetical protein PMAYCL1PPCAC_06706, partial [Pristionchus mayeri]
VVTNRIFHIISTLFLIAGVILSGVGITLIIISSTSKCTRADQSTSAEPTPTVPTSSETQAVCPPQECKSTMFGAQINMEYPFDEILNYPDSDDFKRLANATSQRIIEALYSSDSKMLVLASEDVLVTYDVQVYRFMARDKGTIAYTSGVAMSTGSQADIPTVPEIRDKMDETLGGDTLAVA